MELLESFGAVDLLRRVRCRSTDASSPASVSFPGAVLFADIKDFTVLAEELCNRGRDGIERLTETMNLAFRSSVLAVEETGGAIACFAGDALLAYWPADDGDVGRASGCAAECAVRLHAALTSPAEPSEFANPTLHIGLSAGILWAIHIGRDERWHVLLAGPPVREACVAAAAASAGETAVSSSFHTVGRLAADAAPPLATTAFEAAPPVSLRVQSFLEEGLAEWLPQHRDSICAVFIRIQGIDEVGSETLPRYQAVVTAMHDALRPFTGSSGALLLDDKGLVFNVTLGIAHDAHIDDRLRGVRAALAVEAELQRLGLGCAIGISSSQALCKPLGGRSRQQYWPAGRAMYVAARLMQHAERGILCDEDIARDDRVRRVVSLTPEPPIQLKGLRWPVRPFRALKAVALDERIDVLFGREDEQALLERCLNEFAEQRGGVLWIVGDAGLGKTALMHDLQNRAARRDFTCLVGGAGSVDVTIPYAAWRPIFATLLTGGKPFTEMAESERRAGMGSLRHPELAALINAVVPGFLPETAPARILTGQARADATSQVLIDVIQSRASQRFILILEDCHWIDSASWRLLLRVAQECPHALIVLTSRPAPEPNELAALRRLEHFTATGLQPLRADAIESIIESVIAGRSPMPEVVGEVAKRAVGNPLFAREYALLLTSGAATRGFEPPLAPRGAADTPLTIKSLIASRLDSLQPAEDIALKAASVIGDEFELKILIGVCRDHIDPDRLDGVLALLAERQLIVPVGSGGARFAFHHALIREVTYGQLPGDRRKELHGRAAETIERVYSPDDLAPYYGTLAHHCLHADRRGLELNYSDRAASQALAGGGFEEAERLLVRCVALASGTNPDVSTSDRIRWHRQLADARHGMGQLESRSAAAHQALRLAGRPRPHTQHGLIAQAVIEMAGMGIRRVLSATATDDPLLLMDVARAYRHSGEVCYFSNDAVGMAVDSLCAVTYASRVDRQLAPSAVLAGAAMELGGILSVSALRPVGERIVKWALALAEQAGDHAAQAYAHLISCLHHVGRGEWVAAEKSAERCQQLCEPMDDRVNWTNAQAVQFWMSHHLGRDDAAAEAAQRLLVRASETGNRQHQAWALRCLAVCALRREDARQALAHLTVARDRLSGTSALNERIPTLGFLALAQLRNGQTWEARATANDGCKQLSRVRRPIGYGSLEGYSALTAVALDAWAQERTPEWHQNVLECLRVLRAYRRSFKIGEPRYLRHLGEFQRLSGKVRAARNCFRDGEGAAKSLRMPWELKACQDALKELSTISSADHVR